MTMTPTTSARRAKAERSVDDRRCSTRRSCGAIVDAFVKLEPAHA